MPERTCADCGAPFVHTEGDRGRPPIRCDECRVRRSPNRRGRCVSCAKLVLTAKGSLAEPTCQPCRRARRLRICAGCGEEFEGKDQRALYCSIPCANRYKARRTKERTCEVCGKRYRYTYSKQRSCGRECGQELKGRERYAVGSVGRCCPLRIVLCECGQWFIKRTTSPRCAECRKKSTYLRRCDECGTAFDTWQPHQRWCSHECRKRVARRIRRHQDKRQSRNVFFKREFDRLCRRHEGRCFYCGDKPDVLYPDHVVPVSRGGSNTIGNILPACLMCNSDKCALLLIEWKWSKRRRAPALLVA